MPHSSIDPDAVTSAIGALSALRTRLDDVEDDLLQQHSGLGHRDVDDAVDAWIDQVADLLRATSELASEQSMYLRNVATTATHTESSVRTMIEHHER